jgi:hypothetical protein
MKKLLPVLMVAMTITAIARPVFAQTTGRSLTSHPSEEIVSLETQPVNIDGVSYGYVPQSNYSSQELDQIAASLPDEHDQRLTLTQFFKDPATNFKRINELNANASAKPELSDPNYNFAVISPAHEFAVPFATF